MKPTFLMGLMGSGKTYFGRMLAEKLSVPFFDLDEWVEQQEGLTIAQIFEKFGEKKFRDLETEYLKKIPRDNRAVVALGGGTPCFNDNIDLINSSGDSIYLKTEIETIISRFSDQTEDRPLIRGKNKMELKHFFQLQLTDREPFYLQAKQIIRTDGLTDQEVLDLMQFEQ